ncbi:MAG TPA: hypothetical protein DDY77_04815 [Clostridiales bacterium]|nr:hypothetical protein [Clostridiales bacterium]
MQQCSKVNSVYKKNIKEQKNMHVIEVENLTKDYGAGNVNGLSGWKKQSESSRIIGYLAGEIKFVKKHLPL